MATTNSNVADLLRQYAAALALEGADRFKVKAYRRAAETIEGLRADVSLLAKNEADLLALPGIGKAISRLIQEIVATGKLSPLEKSVAKLPTELIELAAYPALDPKKIARIYQKLQISSLAELREQLASGQIRQVLGARLEFHVRQGLDQRPRTMLWHAQKLLPPIEQFLQDIPTLTRFSHAGSLRRKKDTVGDFKFLVSGRSASPIFKRFAQFGAVRSSEARGKHESSFQLSSGVTVNLAWSRLKDWGLSLVLHTGSTAHLDELQTRAAACRLRLSSTAMSAKRFDVSEEEGVYSALGLSFVEPELREGRGEIEAAAAGNLPTLITAQDLRGDLHMHTTASDGGDTIEQMAEAAQERGYEYIAITDHSQSLKLTNGLSEKRLVQQVREIDKLNARLKNFRILKSAEVDILEDGQLDYSQSVLKELDLTICSIHSRFALNKQQQTERILRAMDNPYFNILGHATGRLLLRREGYEIDIDRLIEHAKANHCYFEINSNPNRLDLSDEYAKLAKDRGVKVAINTDAHSTDEMNFITAGINQARRAWLEPSDVLNTLPLPKLKQALRR